MVPSSTKYSTLDCVVPAEELERVRVSSTIYEWFNKSSCVAQKNLNMNRI